METTVLDIPHFEPRRSFRLSTFLVAYEMGIRVFAAAAGLFQPFFPKVRQYLLERQNWQRQLEGLPRSCLWFHFSSSGEFEQCASVMDALRSRSQDKILATYFSPTGGRAIRLEEKRRESSGRKLGWDAVLPLPIDGRREISAFLDRVQPKSAVFVHREFWPGIFHACAQRGIPLTLIAVGFSRRLNGLGKWLTDCLPKSATWNFTDSDSMQNAGLKGVIQRVDGDPRVDRVLARKAVACTTRQDVPPLTLTFASVWKEDAARLLEGIQTFCRAFPEWRILIVPHEPDRELQTFLAEGLGKAALRCIEVHREAPISTASCGEGAVFVSTAVGTLFELYRESSVVFVGGSFRGRVHSVLEPACYGLPIVTGPHVERSRDALGLQGVGALEVAKDGLDLWQRIHRICGSTETRHRLSERALRFVQEKAGASERLAERIVAMSRSLPR